jgi:hypothetical protein
MRTTHQIGASPFQPIPDFRQFATDPTARIRLKEVPMSEPNDFDLVRAIRAAQATTEALISIRGAIVSGGKDCLGLLADAHAREVEQEAAMAGLPAYLQAAINEAAMAAVEHREAAE